MKKTILPFIAIGVCLLLFSFISIERGKENRKVNKIASTHESVIAKIPSAVADESEIMEKVYSFVETHVMAPIQKAEQKQKGKKGNVEYFSRCPSGLEPTIISDSVKADRFVYGKVNNWKGCQAKGICVFRVCVNKKIAQVRDIGGKEYFTVSEWVDKKYPKEIKS
jgi:hypothetical protein